VLLWRWSILATCAEGGDETPLRTCHAPGFPDMSVSAPVVSVILPVYNAQQLLTRCLDSLSGQTFQDFEVIAVDDGSTDGSGTVLDACGFGEHLQVVHQQNGGASSARNAALRRARGEYVFMMDADDVAHPQLLERAVAAARAAEADFVIFDFEECSFDNASTLVKEEDVPASSEILPVPPLRWFVEAKRLPALWQFLWRRESMLGLSFVEGIMFEDNAYIYAYLARRMRGVHLPLQLYCYFNVETSVMHVTKLQRRLDSMEAVLRRLKADVPASDYDYLLHHVYVYWVKSTWRGVRRRGSVDHRLFCSFLRRALADGLFGWSLFPLRWRIRFLVAFFRHGRS